MLRASLVPIFTVACLSLRAANLDLTSPDDTVHYRLGTDSEGHLLYSVTQHGQPRLVAARAGLIIDSADLGAGTGWGEARTRTLSEVFPWRGNKTMATNLCRASEISVWTRVGVEWTLEVRVFNDGVAFRYRVPGTGIRRVLGESTSWQLPKDCTVWFQTDTRNYEGVYQSARADQVPLEQEVEKKRRPVHLGLPMTVAFVDGGYGLINEAALYDYSGLTLRPEGDARFRAAFEDDPGGWSHDGAILSPWRVIVLAKDLDGLVNSDVIPALCEPPIRSYFPRA